MNKLTLFSSALILAGGLLTLPAYASEQDLSTELAGEMTEELVGQVVVVYEELSHELQLSIHESVEMLWEDRTDSSKKSDAEGQE